MSQVPDWNTPGPAQPTQPTQYGDQYGQPQYGQPQYGQPQQYGAVNPQAMVTPGSYPMPGIVPPGMYFDQSSGLTLPNGTELASPGLRVAAYFLAAVLWTFTLFIGYFIWGAVTWGQGRTPTQQILSLRCWKLREQAPASWGSMLLRGLGMVILDYIAFGGLVSFVMFLVNKDRRTLYDHLSGIVVLHDPDKVLTPAQPR